MPQFWYKPLGWKARLLRPLSWLYLAVTALRAACYRYGLFRVTKVSAPVIVVGNISVGGTGKSPMVAYLVKHLQSLGWRPGIVSRGYGGTLNRTPTLLTTQHTAHQVGDEALMLFQQLGVPVVVGIKRAKAAAYLLEQTDCTIVISDDGLQHHALARDLELIMVDAKRQFGNGLCLPAGPLRESSARIRRTPWVIYTSGERERYTLNLHPGDCYALGDSSGVMPLAQLRGKSVHAVAGIGYPGRFFKTLRDLGCEVVEHAYADHHVFKSTDLQFDDDRFVVITEKDAVKCTALALQGVWILPVVPVLPANFVADFGLWLAHLT